jgi:TMEM175 potassium channel family protein
MGKSRLEAFSDGVIAIIITIMVLELRAPHGASLDSLRPLVPAFLSYALSFVYVGIYWNNHHHLLQSTQRVSGGMLWANLYLLFWLSLIPFATAWMDESDYAPRPTALYGLVLLMAAIAYWILQHLIILSQGSDSILKRAVGRDWKGRLSPLFYIAAILLSPWASRLSLALYVLAALVWLIPDRRIEHVLQGMQPGSEERK